MEYAQQHWTDERKQRMLEIAKKSHERAKQVGFLKTKGFD